MITLTSDFGTPYPAAMKGVLTRRTDARFVDIGHDFPRQDIKTTAFWLREILPSFPSATHLVVVDPGVGTDRQAIVLEAGGHTLVGPDNGVLIPATRRLADGADLEAYVIDEHRLERVEPTGEPPQMDTLGSDDTGPTSNTFHGRDVFAPAAAAVHDADRLETLEWCSPVDSVVDLELPSATVDSDRARGEVLVVDDFGNVVTNVPGRFLDGTDRILANGMETPAAKTFAAVDVGQRLATVGSHGYVELDVNQGRGDEAFDLEVGDAVVLEANGPPVDR